MIRLATIDDAPAIAAIEQSAFGPDAWSPSLVDLELAAPGRVIVVAEHDSDLIGYASAAVIADVADLTRIAVVTGSRREGAARGLLADLLDQVARRGVKRMMLEVADDNTAALALYAAVGFAEVARRRDYYGRGRDAVVMELAPITPRDRVGP